MPPTRTAKDKKPSAKYGRLSSYGFTRVSQDEALGQASEAQIAKSTTSGTSSKRKAAKRQQKSEDDDKEEEEERSELKKKKLPKPVIKGEKTASFQCNSDWDDKYHKTIGTSTKKIEFGAGFVLKNEHIEQILDLGPRVCNSLTDFIFNYVDVSYSAHNSMKDVTEDIAVLFATSCPNLRKVQLQHTRGLGDDTFLAFCKNCPKLTSLEITGCNVTQTGFDSLSENSSWVPDLKKLRLDLSSKKGYMKGMRDLTKVRETLTVQLVTSTEEKNWGDWDLITTHDTYKKGRKQKDNSGRRKYDAWDDEREYNRYRMTGDISESFLMRHGYY